MKYDSLLLNTLEHHSVLFMFALVFGQVRLQGFRELVESVVISKKKVDSTEK